LETKKTFFAQLARRSRRGLQGLKKKKEVFSKLEKRSFSAISPIKEES